jgi:hypothetical protein
MSAQLTESYQRRIMPSCLSAYSILPQVLSSLSLLSR